MATKFGAAMHLPQYDVEVATGNDLTYKFISVGPQGSIAKLIAFSWIEEAQMYNLGFGDLQADGVTIDDTSVTNNGDRALVLATVAATTYWFLLTHPNVVVFAVGSTPERTRLYQMGITANWDWLKDTVFVFGYREEQWQSFEKGRNYEAFYVTQDPNFIL